MALGIVHLGAGGDSGGSWTCDRRLCLTEDRSRVVPEDTAAARTLWAIPGDVVPLAEAIRLGAVEAPAAEAESDAPSDEGDGDNQADEKPAPGPAKRTARRS